jgi:hypothetical protein
VRPVGGRCGRKRRIPKLACLLALTLGAVALLVPIAPAAKKHHKTVNVTAKSSGRTIHLRVGDRLDVVLYASEGTAYRWKRTLKPRAGVLKFESAHAIPPAVTIPPTVGGQTQFTYTYRAKGRGTTHLRYALVSTFKGKHRPTAKRLRLRIVVKR